MNLSILAILLLASSTLLAASSHEPPEDFIDIEYEEAIIEQEIIEQQPAIEDAMIIDDTLEIEQAVIVEDAIEQQAFNENVIVEESIIDEVDLYDSVDEAQYIEFKEKYLSDNMWIDGYPDEIDPDFEVWPWEIYPEYPIVIIVPIWWLDHPWDYWRPIGVYHHHRHVIRSQDVSLTVVAQKPTKVRVIDSDNDNIIDEVLAPKKLYKAQGKAPFAITLEKRNGVKIYFNKHQLNLDKLPLNKPIYFQVPETKAFKSKYR
ncbi:hypothetical protein [Paraferrimonas sp. SM1919]|uniref:hypothetical protein n=1 Tax=Paraferrimonas sp. SM1919 TaxID=2662263 RepID=UPI0013D449AF|nr:hypothetical protein [Paraferrimonas sp. SM1919]